jgi:hypothetical protein
MLAGLMVGFPWSCSLTDELLCLTSHSRRIKAVQDALLATSGAKQIAADRTNILLDGGDG